MRSVSSRYKPIKSREAILKVIHCSLIVAFFNIQISSRSGFAQSIGYYPHLNLGFNPYLSPLFGYGLGLPFGAHSANPLKYPWFKGITLGADNAILGKAHLKSFLKSFSYGLHPSHGTFKNKLTLIKHPEYAFTPYGLDYGLGKHYGSLTLPNNPYKSVYGDYYTSDSNQAPSFSTQSHTSTISRPQYGQNTDYMKAKAHVMTKPLIKFGALLAAAALLKKKTIDIPSSLNPSGMIGNQF